MDHIGSLSVQREAPNSNVGAAAQQARWEGMHRISRYETKCRPLQKLPGAALSEPYPSHSGHSLLKRCRGKERSTDSAEAKAANVENFFTFSGFAEPAAKKPKLAGALGAGRG